MVLPDVAAMEEGSKASHTAVCDTSAAGFPVRLETATKILFHLILGWSSIKVHGGRGKGLWAERQHPFQEPHRWPFLAEEVWWAMSEKVQSWWCIMTILLPPWVCTIQRSWCLLGSCQVEVEALSDSRTRRLLLRWENLGGYGEWCLFCPVL